MKTFILISVSFYLFTCSLFSQKYTIEYFGQKPPEDSAEIFAPGIISTEYNEFTPTFSADATVFYFSRKTDYFRIYEIQKDLQSWSQPHIASFSGEFDDVDCVLSPNGTKLFFASKRPLLNNELKNDYDFWCVERKKDEWGVPEHEGDMVNSKYNDLFSSVSNKGTKYFDYQGDIYRSVLKDGRYLEKEKLEGAINTNYLEKEPFISPDESYLIFVSNRPDNNIGGVDLYISFQLNDTLWSKPVNMGKSVNSTATDQAPVVSLDEKYLFFSSRRKIPSSNKNQYGNGSSDIYWVSSEIINALKTNTLNTID